MVVMGISLMTVQWYWSTKEFVQNVPVCWFTLSQLPLKTDFLLIDRAAEYWPTSNMCHEAISADKNDLLHWAWCSCHSLLMCSLKITFMHIANALLWVTSMWELCSQLTIALADLATTIVLTTFATWSSWTWTDCSTANQQLVNTHSTPEINPFYRLPLL